MQGNKVDDTTGIKLMPMSELVTNQNYKQNPSIKRTRKIVLILLGIQLVKKLMTKKKIIIDYSFRV